ncbi:MAG TPA: NADH-quinone oxidoreductase subunit H [Rhodopila sp.]
MTFVLSLLAEILHIGLMIAVAPAAAGVTCWLDARLAGQSGPPALLPFRDLARLRRKTPMAIESVSLVSRLAPAVGLGVTLSAAALVPTFSLGMALSPLADVLVIVSLLTVARVAHALAALDSGAALPGLTQQRASALAVAAEPALMLTMVALGLMGGSFNLDLIIGQQREGILLPAAASAIVLTAVLALAFADLSAPCRDSDQAFGAIDLALVRATGWLRRLVWFNLIGALFLPVGMANAESGPFAWLVGLAAWTIKLGAFLLVVAGIRVVAGGSPRNILPDLAGVAALLALLATIMILASAGTA